VEGDTWVVFATLTCIVNLLGGNWVWFVDSLLRGLLRRPAGCGDLWV
jgi:hypothetical protein